MIRAEMGSQSSSCNTGVMCSIVFVQVIIRAAAFWTICSLDVVDFGSAYKSTLFWSRCDVT